jgi:hypothetical protein
MGQSFSAELVCQPCCGQLDEPRSHRIGSSSRFSRASVFVRPDVGEINLRYVGLALPTAEPESLLLDEVAQCSASSAKAASAPKMGGARGSINVQHNYPSAGAADEVDSCSGSTAAAQLTPQAPPAVCWHKFEVASPRRTTLSLVTHRYLAGRVEKVDEFLMEVPAFSMWQFGVCLGPTSLDAISSGGSQKTVVKFDDASLWDVHHRWTQVDREVDTISATRLQAACPATPASDSSASFQLLRFALVPRVAGRVRFTDVSIEDLEFQVNDRVYDAATYPYPVFTVSLVQR